MRKIFRVLSMIVIFSMILGTMALQCGGPTEQEAEATKNAYLKNVEATRGAELELTEQVRPADPTPSIVCITPLEDRATKTSLGVVYTYDDNGVFHYNLTAPNGDKFEYVISHPGVLESAVNGVWEEPKVIASEFSADYGDQTLFQFRKSPWEVTIMGICGPTLLPTNVPIGPQG